MEMRGKSFLCERHASIANTYTPQGKMFSCAVDRAMN